MDFNMNEFLVIKIMNEAMLRLHKSKNENYVQNEKINEYLKDEAFFFKIHKNIAIKILVCVGVAEDKLELTYLKLVKKEVYDKLIKEHKIKATDNLVVKYD